MSIIIIIIEHIWINRRVHMLCEEHINQSLGITSSLNHEHTNTQFEQCKKNSWLHPSTICELNGPTLKEETKVCVYMCVCVWLALVKPACPQRSGASVNMCFVSKCWIWKQALLLSAGIWLWCGVHMNEERNCVKASQSFISSLHMLLIKALFYILRLGGKGDAAEVTPQLVFNGVLLAHISINTDLKP